jgi:tRNA uridine 5-carboxymethylaminomethyl modification enzyme
MEQQDGEAAPFWFSFYEHSAHPIQLPCYLTFAGEGVKQVITRHLKESALYGGAISGRGPRYCPSVEDKIVKFPEAPRHQVFLEPEGLDTTEMYVNGLSTSLPASVQLEFLHQVPGLEQAKMTRAGYAIEYDYFPPTQLTPALQVRGIDGLYFAGQVNGTTGYEEAAGQGVVAGLNAASAALEMNGVVIRRDQAFIGVLVDDLVNRGVDEPYRLFTSRAEYRLLLRQDNALRRLLPLAESRRLLTDEELRIADSRMREEEKVLAQAKGTSISPSDANPILHRVGTSEINQSLKISELARRPSVPLADLLTAVGVEVSDEALIWGEMELKYEGYLSRERANADRLATMDTFDLALDLPYTDFKTVSFEGREKLDRVRPTNLGQASRIPGISPSDLQGIILEVLRRRR